MQCGKAENDYGHESPPLRRPPLTIIADDLTGACDAAVAFTSRCSPVRVHLSREATDSSPVQALTTESRHVAAQETVRRLRNIADRFPPPAELFKKIDSVFRGNTVLEIEVALRHAAFDLAIVAPAYPALGRIVEEGGLKIHDSTGTRGIPIAHLLAEGDCSLARIAAEESAEQLAASISARIADGSTALLCDASTQTHLNQIVRAARSISKQILWIGSGGLAQALAAELPLLYRPGLQHSVEGSTIFFIGSPHPVSRAQVDHLRRVARIAEHNTPATHTSDDDLLVPVTLGQTTPGDIRHALAVHGPERTGCLFMTGGDTAHFVCRALEIRSLRLLYEFAPGVPVGVAEGGRFDGVRVLLKSGGFGEADLLCRLLEPQSASSEVAV